MGAQRGIGSRSSQTQADILQACREVMLEHGYAAVTNRSVATRAGVTPGLVQYYFPDLDKLFITVIEAGIDASVAQLESAAASDAPLRAVWEYANDKAGAALMLEFMALANHRKAIGPVIGQGGERMRQALVTAMEPALRRYGSAPPAAVIFLMSAIPRMIQLEQNYGTVSGHAEVIEMVENILDHIERDSAESK
ncbi:TetR/AcrR family transcriptional regulator [Nocardia alni]|uniref:TetR/AcrR family transcriptional regulator n=1 Tax=Nocardia alni TaxID=2815723 RepID=UPI001C23A932|nr:TetR/AcrR family transcriptional regulator [Nocardia alni]